MMKLQHCYLPVLLAGILYSADIGGPIAGYATDSSQTQLRAVLGVPGAFAFSAPLALPSGVSRLRLAPGQDYAIAERSGDAPVILTLHSGSVDRVIPIDGAMAMSDWVAFSPRAGSAMLISSEAHRLQVLTGLPGSPRIRTDIDLNRLPEAPATGAVSEDGGLVVLASRTTLYRLSDGGDAQLLLSLGSIPSVSLVNATDVAVADSSMGAVHVVHNIASKAEAHVVVSGLANIGDLFPSQDGKSLFVAQREEGAVRSVDLASGEVRTYATPAGRIELLPLRNRDTFLLAAESGKPGWVFYRDGLEGRVVFIPAIEGRATEIPVRRTAR